jgi:multiple sugar transport system permease protein
VPPAPTRRRRRPVGDEPGKAWLIHVPLVLYLLFTLIPFYWMLVFAVRPTGSTQLVPWPITWEHFDTVWNDIGFGVFFYNSMVIGIGVLVFVVILSVMGGYALARFKFRGQRVFLLALLCTQFIPGAMMLIPLFVIFREAGLLNSLTGLIVADVAFQLPLALILMSGFVRNVSVELEEAAMVDGCTRLRAFFAVTLPQLKPALVAVGSFAFIGAWNNFLFALMFASRQDKFTLPVGLSYALGEFNTDFGALAAGGVVAAVPVVLVFAVVQRFLVQGLSAGAVKG